MAQTQMASFSLVFLAFVVYATRAHNADLCAQAEDIPLCQSIVKGGTDPRAALKAAIDGLIMETMRAEESSGSLPKSQFIGVCKTNLNSAVDSLQESIQSLNINDKHSLNTYISAAITFYSTCEDAVKEGGADLVSVASGVSKTQNILMHIANTCLYLSTLV